MRKRVALKAKNDALQKPLCTLHIYLSKYVFYSQKVRNAPFQTIYKPRNIQNNVEEEEKKTEIIIEKVM